MATGDNYRVAHNQSVHGITCVNICVYQQTGSTASITSEQDLAFAYQTTVVTPHRTLMGPAWRSECIVVSKIAPGAASKYHLVTGLAGTAGAGESLPAKSVACFTHYTNQLGKRGRGRWYFSGWYVTDEKDNCWSSTLMVTKFVTLGNALIAQAAGGPGGGVFDPGMVDSVTSAFSPLIKIEPRSDVRCLRSRTERRPCG